MPSAPQNVLLQKVNQPEQHSTLVLSQFAGTLIKVRTDVATNGSNQTEGYI